METKLIENALALTWKSMEDMEVVSGVIYQQEELTYRFSIEKFCYYLLSEKFIAKYTYDKDINYLECSQIFWQAIFEYQVWFEEPLIELLSKIWNQ